MKPMYMTFSLRYCPTESFNSYCEASSYVICRAITFPIVSVSGIAFLADVLETRSRRLTGFKRDVQNPAPISSSFSSPTTQEF
jgi:hypothetical protein